MTIHWIGTGLSAAPGLRRLIKAGHSVQVWNRTIAKAQAVVGDLTTDIHAYSPQALRPALRKGDMVVSMLPADLHPVLGEMAIEAGAHFVCSSYLSPQVAALDDRARRAGVAVVNEVGLDPGIDHLMAHELVADYSHVAQEGDQVHFTSYCGGVPRYINPFRYKFSWSPLGVLRALQSPSVSIRDGAVRHVQRPWHAVEAYDLPLPTPERFEVYPNRDARPFIEQYGFDPAWDVQDFVRGTLRLKGWQEAWSPVFARLEALSEDKDETGLTEMADRLWRENAYAEGEADRVVMCVALQAQRNGQLVWHKEWVLDAHGNHNCSAMARLVSVPVALAVEAVADGQIAPGVSAGSSDPELIANWLVEIGNIVQYMSKLNHLRSDDGAIAVS